MSVKRTIVFYSFIIFSFAALIFRLFYIIDTQSSTYAAQSSNSYKLLIDKKRGNIYDRNLVPLVSNEAKYKVAVLPSIQSKTYLHSVLTKEKFEEISDKFSKGLPFTFETDTFIEESADVEVYLVRERYSKTSPASHFIGYCDSGLAYGITGIEKAYDELYALLYTDHTLMYFLSYPIQTILILHWFFYQY